MADDLTKSNTKPLNGTNKYDADIAKSKTRQEELKGNREQRKREFTISERRRKQGEARSKSLYTNAQRIRQVFQARKLSASEMAMRRNLQVARMRSIQAQRMAAMRQTGGYDNKFERQFEIDRRRFENIEIKRRFRDIPDDLHQREAGLIDQENMRRREFAKRNNILNFHKKMLKVNLDMLRVDDTCNLCNTPRIWREDNPDNNVFRDTGRPTIMDTPNAFAVTPESQRWNILNAQKLNFGNVDTRRKVRRFNTDPNFRESF